MQPASRGENGGGCNQGKLRVCDQASLGRPERRISCVGPRSPRGWRVRKEGRRDADLRDHGGGGGGAGRADARARRNAGDGPGACLRATALGTRAAQCRSEEHTSELQSLMRTSYAVLGLQKKTKIHLC